MKKMIQHQEKTEYAESSMWVAFCLNTFSLQVSRRSGVLAIQRDLADNHAEDRSTSDFEDSRLFSRVIMS